MKLLLIGSGGREPALAWKLAQSVRVAEIHVAPGKAGTATEAKCRNVRTAAAAQIERSRACAREFLHRCGIPTAADATFADLDAPLAHIAARSAPLVVKADGLAAGMDAGLRARTEEAAPARAMLGK